MACTLPPIGLILLLIVGFVCPSNIPLTAIAGIIVKTGTGLELGCATVFLADVVDYAAFENSPSPSYLLPVSAQVIKKIQDGKTNCIYIKNTYKLGYESIQMLDTYSRNKYMKDISIPCHKVDKAAIESGELDALLTN